MRTGVVCCGYGVVATIVALVLSSMFWFYVLRRRLDALPSPTTGSKSKKYVDTKRKDDIRHANMVVAKAVVDVVRTSLAPWGMDKMLSTTMIGDVIITNDGATILDKVACSFFFQNVMYLCKRQCVS